MYRPRTDAQPPIDRVRIDLEFARIARSPCPELDCIRHRLAPATLAAVEQRALALNVSAERVLVTAQAMSEDSYVVALAASLRLPFEPLESIPREDCPLSDEQLAQADVMGCLPLWIGGQGTWVIAPLKTSARWIIAIARARPECLLHIRLTSARRLRNFVTAHGAAFLEEHAAYALRAADPALSAGGRGPPRGLACLLVLAALMVAALMMTDALLADTGIALSSVFWAWTGLRVIGAVTPWRPAPPLRIRSDALPLYTIIVALYDEAAAVQGLTDALRRLDYPPEKLQIILALEPDDHATRNAVARLKLDTPFEVVLSPKAGPRTKPKALNAALAFARGEFVAVFDAEDRPEPDQLHRALAVFHSEGQATACVQAQLSIDNTGDSWLSKMFTAEYAGLFDVLLPGLARLRLPLPLGGSSNHFRAHVLREVGGWDAYNVTEDADLGMRLARRGFHSAVIISTTFEEAPYQIKHWLPQRTRWFKGWMQTWAVHMRHPVRLARDLGWAGFATFQLVVGGTVLSALVHPLFLAWLAYSVSTQGWSLLAGFYGCSIAVGYSASVLLALIGLKRRKLLSQSHVLLAMPLHWMLLSLAAWRALRQFAFDPYRWEKTAHGLSKTRKTAASRAT